MTESPTTSGSCSATSRSTVSGPGLARAIGPPRRPDGGDRRCRRATSTPRSACGWRSAGMCSNESGIENSRMFIGVPPALVRQGRDSLGRIATLGKTCIRLDCSLLNFVQRRRRSAPLMTSTRAIALPLARVQTLSFASILAAQSPPIPRTQDARPREVTMKELNCTFCSIPSQTPLDALPFEGRPFELERYVQRLEIIGAPTRDHRNFGPTMNETIGGLLPN